MYNKLFLLPQPNPSKTPASKRTASILPDYLTNHFGKLSPYLHEKLLKGEQTYNFPLCTHNGRDNRIDAFQELLDAILYLITYLEEQEDLDTPALNIGTALRCTFDAISILLTELENSYD